MRVAVLGAGGTIAPAIVRDLAESDEVTAMRLLDLDLRRAEEVAIEHGGGKAQARQADATSDLAEQLAGMDVLVNSAAYRINLAAMGACLDAGCHYMDLGGLYHVTAEQLELSGEVRAERAAGAARDRLGSGKTNLLAARAVRELPGSPTSISVLAAGRDLDPPDGHQLPLRAQDPARRDHDAPDGADRWQAARAGAPAARPDRRLRRADRRGGDDLHPPLGGPHLRRQLRRAERDLCALAVTQGAREPGEAAGGERGADCRSCSLRIAPLSKHRLRPHR